MKIIDLGYQPITNRYVRDSDNSSILKFPLGLEVDKNSGVICLNPAMPYDELRPRVPWIKAFEPEDHLDELVNRLISLPGITKESIFSGYSFKDASTIKRIDSLGFKKNWIIDPKDDLQINEENAGIETFQAALDVEKAIRIREKYGAPDIFILRHVIEHSYSLNQFIKFIKTIVSANGYLVIELPDCTKPLQQGDCTMIWEEHLFYFTKNSFRNFLLDNDFEIIDLYEIEYPLENCMIAIVKNSENKNYERGLNNDDAQIAFRYRNLFLKRKDAIREVFQKIGDRGERVAIFGAGHYSVAFLSYLNISEYILFAIDDDANKVGYRLPLSSNVTIFGSDMIDVKNIDICLLGLNPAHHEKVINKHKTFISQGGKFASIFPGGALDILSQPL